MVTSVLDLPGRNGFLLATEDGVFEVVDNAASPFAVNHGEAEPPAVSVMARGSGEDFWFLGSEGRLLHCPSGEDCQAWNVDQSTDPFYPYQVVVDREGVVWIASSSGLERFENGKTEVLKEDAGLSNSFVIDLLLDRDQVLWVATESGLDKISQHAFRNFSWQKDFPVNSVWAIEEMPDGSVWMGTNAGIVTVDPDWHYKGLDHGRRFAGTEHCRSPCHGSGRRLDPWVQRRLSLGWSPIPPVPAGSPRSVKSL